MWLDLVAFGHSAGWRTALWGRCWHLVLPPPLLQQVSGPPPLHAANDQRIPYCLGTCSRFHPLALATHSNQPSMHIEHSNQRRHACCTAMLRHSAGDKGLHQHCQMSSLVCRPCSAVQKLYTLTLPYVLQHAYSTPDLSSASHRRQQDKISITRSQDLQYHESVSLLLHAHLRACCAAGQICSVTRTVNDVVLFVHKSCCLITYIPYQTAVLAALYNLYRVMSVSDLTAAVVKVTGTLNSQSAHHTAVHTTGGGCSALDTIISKKNQTHSAAGQAQKYVQGDNHHPALVACCCLHLSCRPAAACSQAC